MGKEPELLSVLALFSVAVIRSPKGEGIYNSRLKSIIMGKSRLNESEAAVHITSTVKSRGSWINTHGLTPDAMVHSYPLSLWGSRPLLMGEHGDFVSHCPRGCIFFTLMGTCPRSVWKVLRAGMNKAGGYSPCLTRGNRGWGSFKEGAPPRLRSLDCGLHWKRGRNIIE